MPGRRVLGFIMLCIAVIGASAGSAVAGEVTLGSPAPELAGGPWINSGALSMAGLRGRVALVEFWTYG